MRIASYKDLQVWQIGVELAVTAYAFTGWLPKSEMYGLASQIQRSAVSIPSNIAEGHGRDTTKDYLRFISIAIGSLAELETQVQIANVVHKIKLEESQQLLQMAETLGRKLKTLQRKLKAKLDE